MKIAPLKTTSPWYGRVMEDETVPTQALSAVPIEATVQMELVELLHGEADENYRPYLHLRGELVEAVPVVDLPYGIDGVVMRQGAGLPVDAFYDFNQAQLAELVSKGYFTPAFRVPDEMTGIAWVLPGQADFLVAAPALLEDAPLVFMQVLDQSEMALDEASTGYNVSSYFPDYTPQAQADQEHVAEDQHLAQVSSDDIFAGMDFDAAAPSRQEAAERALPDGQTRLTLPEGVFERLLVEIEAHRAPEPVQEAEPLEDEPAPEPVVLPGSAADVYETLVSPGVERVLSGEPDPEPVAPDALEVEPEPTTQPIAVVSVAEVVDKIEDEPQFLDLSAPVTELAPVPMATGASPAAHRAAAARRAAVLQAELTADEDEADLDEGPESFDAPR